MEIMDLTRHGVEVLDHQDDHIVIRSYGIVDSARDLIAETLFKQDAERVQKRLKDFDVNFVTGGNDFTIVEHKCDIVSEEELRKIITYLDTRLPNNIQGVSALEELK